ncbi:MAG: hypothetical protein QM656_10700 [Paracoccaceae bacterium]
MSAPQTNIETQERRHRGPLIGMAFAVLVGVGAILFWMFGEVATAPAPGSQTGDQPTQAAPAN